VIVGLRLASAAAGLIVIGLLWYKSLARLPKTSPNTDEGGMLMMSLVVTTALVLGAVGVLVGITIRQLRRS
jgi:peptidoglycan biosynthesis protein MviN/MurJ (putative lipid II flippase)